MQSQDAAPRPPVPATDPAAPPSAGPAQAEAALVEHYPRLVRIAHLVLPAGPARDRRVLTAHALVQRALPRGRTAAPAIPAQHRRAGRAAGARDGETGYALVRLQVVRTALEAALPLRRRAWPRRAQLPPLLPLVRGLRLFPRSGGADELALEKRLSALSAAARAAYVLRGLEDLADTEVREVLTAAGVTDAAGALREADGVPERYALLNSPSFDACSLQARPTDLLRRRQHTKAALAAAAALAVCGALVAVPGDGWGPDGAAAPAYALNPAAEAALDPARLVRVSPTAWELSARTDFSVWPARGELRDDKALLRRALAVWARPGERVRVSVTPGTPSGAPAGPPQLLYAGTVDNARVVILHDGLRIARYAEPASGTRGAALDLARTDGANGAESGALVLGRSDGNTRYLTAPWVTGAAERDLLRPGSGAMDLHPAHGVTTPLAGPGAQTGGCTSWNVLELTGSTGTQLLSDLGELVPARLTEGRPGAVRDVAGARARTAWAPYACSLATARSQGVRTVNLWPYATQQLPDGSGSADWVCTRAETWRGGGTRALAQFHTSGGAYGAVVAQSQDGPGCGPREPRVLAGVLWKSAAKSWYLLAAGSRDTTSVTTTGGVRASAQGSRLAVPAGQGARVTLRGTLSDGRRFDGLH
ncbi:hypothetical protein [Streptomyces sp. NPDC047000]|uniref:hypothetical protein n=1 Tax=Streptomyces sp. NPDC047000 TaxID=3155474 RepID=UPI0033E3B909